MTARGRAPRLHPGAPAAPSFAAHPLEAPIAALVALLAFAWRYRDSVRMPFVNDDYVFLDATANRSFASLWGFDRLYFHWWRPWSRELHYWWLQRAAGPSEPVFHVVNLALAYVVFALFHDLARALLGRGRAAVATAATAAMAAWALPLLWVAGVQDLWMLAWSLASLALWRRDLRVPALLAYALALASKETAAMLPLLWMAWDVTVARRAPVAALVRALPAALIALPWAWAHPQIGGRLLRHVAIEAVPASGGGAAPAVLRSAMAMASADAAALFSPDGGWLRALLEALPGAILFAALVLVAASGAPRHERPVTGAATFGLAWCAVGWLPLLLPGLGWHAYYGLFGAFGAWLVIASRLRPGAAAALVVALLAVTSSLRDAAVSKDWGDAWYQRRAGAMLSTLRDDLRRQVPRPDAHTRFWFVAVPNNIGFLQGDGPALRTWYADTTLRASFFSAWRRAPADAPGTDRFFKLGRGPRWLELVPGPEDVAHARAENPDWAEDHLSLGRTFVDGGAWDLAAFEFKKVADAQPSDAEPAYNLAAALGAMGDQEGMRHWLEEARRRPVVTERLRAAARASGLDYW